jgi:hypothetical protein
VRYFWHTLEPKTRPMIEGWVVEAICLHLEAITFGDIPSNRLLINVPPGFMKSLLVNVFWPAWEWGPCDLPHMRYISFSYSDEITTRDNNKMVRLIQSPAYRQLWGDRFSFTKTGERRHDARRHLGGTDPGPPDRPRAERVGAAAGAWSPSAAVRGNCPRGSPGHRLPLVALMPQWRQDYSNNRPPTRATAISAMGQNPPPALQKRSGRTRSAVGLAQGMLRSFHLRQKPYTFRGQAVCLTDTDPRSV